MKQELIDKHGKIISGKKGAPIHAAISIRYAISVLEELRQFFLNDGAWEKS